MSRSAETRVSPLPPLERPYVPVPPPHWLRYLLATVLVAVALGATAVIHPFVPSVIFIFYWPAVIAAAAFGGVRPGIYASVLSVVAVDFFIVNPQFEFDLYDDLIPFVVLAATAWFTGRLVHRLRLAREHASEVAATNAELAMRTQEQAIELEQQIDEVQSLSSELEHQMEEAQALSEELQHTNEELGERTAEAEAAERYTHGILESIADPFFVFDRGWHLRYSNGAAADLLTSTGVRPDELAGHTVWEEFPALLGTDFERAMRRSMTERVPVRVDAFRPERGVWSELYCYPLQDGGLAVQQRDITDRKRAEEAAQYLARASEVLSSSLDYEKTLAELARIVVPELADWAAVEIVDVEGGPSRQIAVAHADPAKLRFARELNERYPPDPNTPTGVPQVLRTGKPEIYPEIPLELLEAGAQDAEHLELIRQLQLRSAIIVPLVARGRTLGALTLISAESKRRYGQEDLELAMELARRAGLAVDNALLHRSETEARQRADEANRAKTQFLAVMSHELRTPLNAISGYAELLSLGIRGPVTDEQKEDLQRIMRSQRHLLSLINDVLNYARLESGHVDYDIEPVRVSELLGDVEPLVRPQLLARNIEYECRSPTKALVVRADREKARQVLLNLLSNAVKFTAPGGRVELWAEPDGRTARIHVRDTGVGIAADKREQVFEPFIQVGRSNTTPQEGTGLGLAISRDLARGMGGDLSVVSEVGQGSTFTLTLPMAARDDA